MIYALSTILLGFILEIIILVGLLFVLYTGWLFIVLTKDENNDDFQLIEKIDISTQMSEIDEKKLKFKNKVFYTFIFSGILISLSSLVLAIEFVLSVVPENIYFKSKEY